MSKLGKTLIVTAAAALAAVPGGPALADYNPCKGQAPGPHCRPPCTYDVDVYPGDPTAGELPTITMGPSGC